MTEIPPIGDLATNDWRPDLATIPPPEGLTWADVYEMVSDLPPNEMVTLRYRHIAITAYAGNLHAWLRLRMAKGGT